MSQNSVMSTNGRVVTVLGGGVLGRRIGACWCAGGFDVNIRDPSPDQRAAALDYINTNASAYNLVTGRELGRTQVFEDLASAVKNAWMVVEAVPEKLQLKISTFADLEKLAPADAILCSNSSSFKSSEMLSGLAKPETAQRILNMHYMMPPGNIIVELMTDGQTSSDLFPFLVDKLKNIGMHPIVARKESTGFVFNRVWAAVKRECLSVLSEGVSVPSELDGVWVEMFSKSSQGPCERMDAVGLDTVALIEQHYVNERGLSGKDTVQYLQDNFIRDGRLGLKSGDKGGLYPAQSHPNPSKSTDTSNSKPTLYFLDIGLSNSPDVALNKGRVLVGDREGHQVRTIVDNQHMPDGLAISKATKRLYWTSMGVPTQNDGAVYSAKTDGSDLTTILKKGSIHTPKQICIDDASGKVYVSDREGLRVMRCNLDGSGQETLIKTGNWDSPSDQGDQTRWCVGIAVSPSEGKFYWTQKGPSKGNQGRIFRANVNMPAGRTCDDRDDIECIFRHLPEPIDLDIEEHTQTLYWTDRGEIPRGNSLNRASLTGLRKLQPNTTQVENAFEILARNLHEAIGLKVDHVYQHIYTTDLGGTVYRFDMNGKGMQRLYEYHGAYSGIALVYD